jgi:hypothetical protein
MCRTCCTVLCTVLVAGATTITGFAWILAGLQDQPIDSRRHLDPPIAAISEMTLGFQAPTVVGFQLQLQTAAALAENNVVGSHLLQHIKRGAGFHEVRREAARMKDSTLPKYMPIQGATLMHTRIHNRLAAGGPHVNECEDCGLDPLREKAVELLETWAENATDHGGSWRDFRWTIRDYHSGYRRGKIIVTEVVENIFKSIEAAENSVTPLRAVVSLNREEALRLAYASQSRYSGGSARSIWEVWHQRCAAVGAGIIPL